MSQLLSIAAILISLACIPFILKRITDEPVFALVIVATCGLIIKIAEWFGAI